MLEVILMLSLSYLNTVAVETAQTTLWPNPCSTMELAQFKPCIWPNKCFQKPVMAQFQPCIWPNKCFQEPVVAQFKPCVWPNKCFKGNAEPVI